MTTFSPPALRTGTFVVTLFDETFPCSTSTCPAGPFGESRNMIWLLPA